MTKNPGSQELMKEINEAYAVLSNAEKRRDYDHLRQSFGSSARDRFRQTHTDEDIFRKHPWDRYFIFTLLSLYGRLRVAGNLVTIDWVLENFLGSPIGGALPLTVSFKWVTLGKFPASSTPHNSLIARYKGSGSMDAR
jgi:hypothetical protein